MQQQHRVAGALKVDRTKRRNAIVVDREDDQRLTPRAESFHAKPEREHHKTGGRQDHKPELTGAVHDKATINARKFK